MRVPGTLDDRAGRARGEHVCWAYEERPLLAAAARDFLAAGIDADDRDAFVRYEHRIDRLVACGLAFTAMCAFDRGRLGDRGVDELACVHPSSHGTTTPFRLHATASAAFALAGEVDALSADELGVALDRVLPATAASSVVPVDCAALRFAEHRALLALDGAAARSGVTLQLLEAPASVVRLASLLELRHVEVPSP